MTRPFPLQTVLELMQTRADEATQQLARLIASERDAKSKLDLLQQYRDEYATRFREAAQNGMTRIQWQNYQEFLNRLDEAISQQHQNVAQQERNTATGQMNWQQQRKNRKPSTRCPTGISRGKTRARSNANRRHRTSSLRDQKTSTQANPSEHWLA